MTTTSDLIETLVDGAEPVARRHVEGRLAAGAGAGVLVSVALMIPLLGLRPDLAAAAATASFWVKFAYTFLLALFLGGAVERLSRPGASAVRPVHGAVWVLLGVTLLALAQLLMSPPEARVGLAMGSSASKCPWLIIAFSLPPLIGSIWAVRGLAPTRLVPAGFAAGLLAGALGALVYSFHCDEFAMPFLAIWYTLGIAAVGAIGTLVARPLLRW